MEATAQSEGQSEDQSERQPSLNAALSKGKALLPQLFQNALGRDAVESVVARYSAAFSSESAADRLGRAAELTKAYYDIVTDFYEYGWGESFHFAPFAHGETLSEAIRRHEHYMALRLGLSADHHVLDVGAGVGGPMRHIAALTNARITGLNISDYQIERANKHNARAGLASRCEMVKADFTNTGLPAASFDAAYTIEAACHAADRRDVFRETFRLLKPGALFSGMEWCLTNAYDPANAEHRQVKLGVEKGNGLPELISVDEMLQSLSDVGFELIEANDLAPTSEPGRPWYSPLSATWSPRGFLHSRAGSALTQTLVETLERLRLSPKGTGEAHEVLRLAQRSLVRSGELGIFTPMFFFLARKPLTTTKRAAKN